MSNYTPVDIWLEIARERARQDAKWGEQNWPSVPLGHDGYTSADFLDIPREEEAKKLCQGQAKLGQCTWGHIAVEELCEAVEAPDETKRRAELVQLAAVVVAWIECIDRRARAK